jgi:hypothetical protein
LQKLIIGYADNNKTTVGALKIKATTPETNKAKPMAFFLAPVAFGHCCFSAEPRNKLGVADNLQCFESRRRSRQQQQ